MKPQRNAQEPASDPDDGDRLRAELKALGYLENPLSRFFAGAALGKRPAWNTHLRIGLATGLVLGLVVALLLALVYAASRPFAPHGAPAVHFALVATLAAFAAFALGLVGSAAMFLLFRWTRRMVEKAELAALCAGVAAFFLFLTYVLLFWRHYGPGLVRAAPLPAMAMHLCAIGGALLLALVVGRVFHLAAFALLTLVPGYEVSRRRTGARRALAVSLLLGLVASVLAVTTTESGTPALREQGETIVRGVALVPRVVLVAVDGMDLRNLEGALERGWMPLLHAALPGALVAPLATGGAEIPPAFWTTAATGLAVGRHRLDAYYKQRVLGLSQALQSPFESGGALDVLGFLLRGLNLTEEVAVSGSASRAKRVVDVAAAAGLRCASVNYWASYPASAFPGTTVSERAFLELAAARRGGGRAPDLEVVAPPEALAWIADNVGDAGEPRDASGVDHAAQPRPVLYDAFVERTVEEVLARESPAFVQAGLTGLDILRHEALGRGPHPSDANLAQRLDRIEAHYRMLDGFFARLREAAGADALLVLAGYPGISATGSDPTGALVVLGPRVAAGRRDAEERPEDLGPTLLYALGLPGSEELDGHADLSWFRGPPLAAALPAPIMVRSFGLKPEVTAGDVSSDEFLEFLRQNGYLSK